MVTLRLFAQARELAGAGTFEFDADTVAEVLDDARGRFGPDFAALLTSSRVWVNGAVAEEGDPVTAGDEIAVLPPVSGG